MGMPSDASIIASLIPPSRRSKLLRRGRLPIELRLLRGSTGELDVEVPAELELASRACAFAMVGGIWNDTLGEPKDEESEGGGTDG